MPSDRQAGTKLIKLIYSEKATKFGTNLPLGFDVTQ